MVGAEIVGDEALELREVAKIEEAGEGDLTFLANPRYRKFVETTKASAILVSKSFDVRTVRRALPLTYLLVQDPYISFLHVLQKFHPPVEALLKGIHSTAVIAKSATLGENPSVGAHVVIGEQCRIGANVRIHPGTVIGDGVALGDDVLLYANVTVRERCALGSRVIVHSGTVIGSDGFGFLPRKDGTYEKIPQRGAVVIEDDVEIGSNCSVDRATLGETRIRRGAKLDNLIQVAHNVTIGENTVIAAQTGISGSTKIGKNCVIGGQVGLVGHIEIADNVTLGAQSGITKSITKQGSTYSGYPAKEHMKSLRMEGALRQLPELLDTIRTLEKKVQDLEREVREARSEVRSP